MPQSSATTSEQPRSTAMSRPALREAVAVLEAVGDEEARLDALALQEGEHHRRRGRPVDVVVAVDEHALAVADGAGDALGGGVHVAHLERVVEAAERRAEERPGLVERGHAAQQEGAGEGVREAVEARGERLGARVVPEGAEGPPNCRDVGLAERGRVGVIRKHRVAEAFPLRVCVVCRPRYAAARQGSGIGMPDPREAPFPWGDRGAGGPCALTRCCPMPSARPSPGAAVLWALVLAVACRRRSGARPAAAPDHRAGPWPVRLARLSGRLFVSTGFGIPQTRLRLSTIVFVTRDGGATWAAVPEFSADHHSGAIRIGRPTVADGVALRPRLSCRTARLRATVLRRRRRAWESLPPPASRPPTARSPTSLGRTVCSTARPVWPSDIGYVFRSADEGASWTRVGAQRAPA